MQKPIILITLAYLTGLLAGHGFLYFPYSIGILIVLGILITGILTSLGQLSLRLFLLTVIPCFIGIAAYVYSAAWIPESHYTRLFTPDTTIHHIDGRITSPLDRDPDRTAFTLELSTIDETPVSGTIRVSVREETTSFGYGDVVRITGKLFKPGGFNNPGGFDYPAYLARNGIYYTVSVKDSGSINLLNRGTGVFRKIQDWREKIRQSFLASTTGPSSAILQAMVIGEEGRLTDDLRDRFMAAGVTHIISISGSHLGMVAILCFGLLRSFIFLLPERFYHWLTLRCDPKKIAAWLTLPLVIFYTLLAGGQVATIRSLIMISTGLMALVLNRENALMPALALAALAILIASPQAIFDISFQLSYLSVLVIAFVVQLWNDLEIKATGMLRRLRNSIALLIIISFATSLATGPLVAHYFNQFSFAGIISNMIVIPFAGMLVVPLGLFSAILSLFTNHLPLAEVNQMIGDAFVAVVNLFARLPFAEFRPPAPNALWLFIYGVFLFSFALAARAALLAQFKPFQSSQRVPRKAVIGMTISGILLLLSLVLFFMPIRKTEITVLDVGQGDCTLVQLRSGKNILIDGGGTYDNRFDIGRRIVAPSLWNKGIRTIDLVILSHPHPDHMNGLHFILKNFNVAEVWESERDPGLPGYKEFRQIIAEKNSVRKTVSAEDRQVRLGGAELSVLHPSRTFTSHNRQAFAAENNRSLVVRISIDDLICLFPGDIGAEAEQHLARSMAALKCDLLKVPHHGSKSSSSDLFVSLAKPGIAIMTVGKANRYRHPSDEVVRQYQENGARIFRTDRDGAITVQKKNGRMEAQAWNDVILTRIDPFALSDWASLEWQNWHGVSKKTLKYP